MNFINELLHRSFIILIKHSDQKALKLKKTPDNKFRMFNAQDKDVGIRSTERIYKSLDYSLQQDEVEILFIAYDGEIFEHVKPRKGVPL